MIVINLSGGKDSVAGLLLLVEQYGAKNLIAHYQVIPSDWDETLGYNQEVCARLGVKLVSQQILYAPRPGPKGTETTFLEVRDIIKSSDIVPDGTPGVIAGLLDLAHRRGWPPGQGPRWCTHYFKERLFDYWLRQNRDTLFAGQREIITVLGERAGESPRRAKKPERNIRIQWKRTDVTAWNCRTIHNWSRRDTFRKLRDWGVRPHPAYRAQGMSERQMYDLDVECGPRQSCRYCIYATYSELCHQAQIESTQGVLRSIIEFERAVGRTWWSDFSARDLTNGQETI